ncbi:T9SS type A sorting domain-containing protein [Sediminibacter sp. Hel_I_10]|uniref:T9SS type A sorting domain-containing protein n=1 Tax=Sediminibacter sp. Hel_I_10 TaxID=1392490 RepID=UPI00047E7ED7|nr:T9SS type A sorting domain-containing protein [Sediminibacter sp. Hel_I_10]
MRKIYFTCLLVTAACISSAQELDKTITVNGGTAVYVEAGTTIYADQVNLKSTSDRFSSLMLNGDLAVSQSSLEPATLVNYDRYVNVVGETGVPGGNDLISMPVKATGDVTFTDFLGYSADEGTTPNSDIIVSSTTDVSIYAFGPYNNALGSYTNYDTDNAPILLERGLGYRAASYSGQTVRFSGTVSTTSETVEITTVDGNYWNTIGNPYPTYLNAQAFLTENASVLDPYGVTLYGYNSTTNSGLGTIGNFTYINSSVNTNLNIAPGQGFLIPNSPDDAVNTLTFTQNMRTIEGTDDFILGRTENQSQMLRLKAQHDSADFATEFYFNSTSTLGLDPGYDAALYNGTTSNFLLYSHLVEDNIGKSMAIQSFGNSQLTDVTIPLGLKTVQGQQVTFSIENSTLPEDVEVYLEDNLTNTFTLLNSGDYSFTANTAISGTGRFFLRIGNSTLSTINQEANSLELFASEKTIFVNGRILPNTEVSVFDIQGRLVLTSYLEEGSANNQIEASNLNSGIYVVKLTNNKQDQTKKVILK